MCGICGFVSSGIHPKLKHSITLKMLEAIRYRGPDDEGVFIEHTIALGVRRLSIIDLATGHQPIHNEDQSLWIVYNGEIYNFAELKELLINKEHVFYTKCDTEVIIHLYEEYGYDCVNKLDGMFAFAIWDKKKDELFLARDRFGIKPLYYSELDGQLLFASEIKSILQFPGFKRDLDLISLDQYLTFEYVPSPRSIFKKILKLPAGHCLIYRNKNVCIRKYWDISLDAKLNSINPIDAERRLLEYLKKAIKKQLISDVPLGIFLSGGIDSSTITALARGLSKNRLETFSIGFREDSFDESQYIHQVAEFLDTEHHHRFFNAADLFYLIPEAAGLLDEPLADASFFPTYLLSKFAKQKVTVALSGDGADELFAGYPTYQAHRIARYYQQIPHTLRKNVIERIIINLPVSMKNFSLDFKAKKFILSANLPMGIRHVYWMGSFNFEDKIKLYAPTLRQTLNREYAFDTIDIYLDGCQADSEVKKLQYFDIKTYLQDDILVKTDRASMLNSLEVRVPYLDHELAEFVFSLPPNLMLNSFKSKYILKKTLRDFLPKNIINRGKKGFGVPVAYWVKKELKKLILDVLGKDRIEREGLFNYRFIEELLQQHFDNKADNRKKIWTLFMFELWQNEYLRN